MNIFAVATIIREHIRVLNGFFGFAMLSITISFMLERPGVPPEGKQANKELNAKATQGRRLVRDEPVKHFFFSKNEISCRRHLHRCFTPICKDQTPLLTSASHKYRRLVHAKADQIKAANSGGEGKTRWLSIESRLSS